MTNMDRCFDMFSVVALAVMTIAMVVVVNGACADARIDSNSEHVYDIVYGSVLCGKIESTNCGITLTNCHDGAEYKCMQNVRRRSE